MSKQETALDSTTEMLMFAKNMKKEDERLSYFYFISSILSPQIIIKVQQLYL